MTKDQEELLTRIDERVKHIKTALDKQNKNLEENYVRKESFDTVRSVAYGAVAGVCLLFIKAVGGLVWPK